MSCSELFFLSAPFLWLYAGLFVVKDEPGLKFIIRWAGSGIVCCLLSFVMLDRVSAVMGGRCGDASCRARDQGVPSDHH
ncbi:MAG: hypothetical protein WCI27_05510 [Candidatus Omnitrophota bacterium]